MYFFISLLLISALASLSRAVGSIELIKRKGSVVSLVMGKIISVFEYKYKRIVSIVVIRRTLSLMFCGHERAQLVVSGLLPRKPLFLDTTRAA